MLLESFIRNGRLNEAVLNAISETDWGYSDGQGGYSIGQHLGELAEFRHAFLSFISPEHADGIPSVTEGDGQGFRLTAQSVPELTRAFVQGDASAKAAVLAALDEGRSFTMRTTEDR
jgi:uncharacterized damage-inducible protein DinB